METEPAEIDNDEASEHCANDEKSISMTLRWTYRQQPQDPLR